MLVPCLVNDENTNLTPHHFQSVKGLPRLNREEELALCEDVQRWQRLEKLREGVAQQRAFAMAGDGRGKVGVDAWAAAAGMTVAVRERTCFFGEIVLGDVHSCVRVFCHPIYLVWTPVSTFRYMFRALAVGCHTAGGGRSQIICFCHVCCLQFYGEEKNQY